MKLTHLVSGTDGGGAKTHMLSLLSELRRSEDVRLCCLGEGVLSRAAEEIGLPVTVLRGSAPVQLAALRRSLWEDTPQILHCHGARAVLLAALARRPDMVFLATVHSDPALDYLGRPLAAEVLPRLYGMALRRMDALVCVSDAMAETYRRRGYAHVYPIYNGLDFSAPPATRGQRDVVTVGTAARLEPVKDLGTLLRGFALAAAQNDRLRLRIAGSGREEACLRALAAALGIADKTEFCGWVQDVGAFFASSDIAALTSLSETFPYALLQAAQQAIPVVTTDVGGVGALVRQGDGGYRIRPGDTAALARCLLELAANEEKRCSMGLALRRYAEAHFTLEQMARRQREIYAHILTQT